MRPPIFKTGDRCLICVNRDGIYRSTKSWFAFEIINPIDHLVPKDAEQTWKAITSSIDPSIISRHQEPEVPMIFFEDGETAA